MTDDKELIGRVKAALEGATESPWVPHYGKTAIRINLPGYEGDYQGRVAQACYWDKGHTGAKCNPLREQAEHNARLIALAPDMARALLAMEAERKAAKELADQVGRRMDDLGGYDKRFSVRAALDAYRKARGAAE